jgi:hypothetical protein
MQFLPEIGELRRLSESQANALVDSQAIRGKCLGQNGPAGVVVLDSAHVTVPLSPGGNSLVLDPEKPADGVTYSINDTKLWCGAAFEEAERLMTQKPGVVDGGTVECFGGHEGLTEATRQQRPQPPVIAPPKRNKKLLSWILPVIAVLLACAPLVLTPVLLSVSYVLVPVDHGTIERMTTPLSASGSADLSSSPFFLFSCVLHDRKSGVRAINQE